MPDLVTLPEHVQWLKDHYGASLKTRLEQEGVEISLDKAIDVLLAADPSSNKGAVDWLVKNYCGDQTNECQFVCSEGSLAFRWEDIAGGEGVKFGKHYCGLVSIGAAWREIRKIYLITARLQRFMRPLSDLLFKKTKKVIK